MELNFDGWGYLEMDRLADTLKAIADAKFHTMQPTLPIKIHRKDDEIDCEVEDEEWDYYKEHNGVLYSVILCDTCGDSFIEPDLANSDKQCCLDWLADHNSYYGK